MSSLVLSDEQKQYQKLAAEFAQREMVQGSHSLEHKGEISEILEKAWQSGLTAVQIPDLYGGLALNLWDTCVIGEELARGSCDYASAIECNALAILTILQAAQPEQKKQFLEPLLERVSFFAMDYEQFAPSIKSEVISKRAEDGYVLTGAIRYLINASIADWFLIFARDEGGDLSAQDSLSAFIVPSTKMGVKILDRPSTIGLTGADCRSVQFTNVELTDENRIGAQGAGRAILEKARPWANLILAATAVGLGQSAMEHAIVYAKERRTFGQIIGQHQAVAFMLSDIAKDVSAARYLVWQAAQLVDQDCLDSGACLTARIFAQEAAMRIATDAVQIFGGYGYSKEYPVEKLLRNAKTYQLFHGPIPALKARLGQQLLSKV